MTEGDRRVWSIDRGIWIIDRAVWIIDRAVWTIDRAVWDADRSIWIADRGIRTIDRAIGISDQPIGIFRPPAACSDLQGAAPYRAAAVPAGGHETGSGMISIRHYLGDKSGRRKSVKWLNRHSS